MHKVTFWKQFPGYCSGKETHLELSHFGERKIWRLEFRNIEVATICKDA